MKWTSLLLLILASMPLAAETPPRHLFYLHGAIIETQGPRPTHPRFGVYEYRQVLAALAAPGLEVHNEVRPARTDVRAYAKETVDEIRSLLETGVPPDDITVVGFSKGGAIAIHTSSILANDRVNFVFLAACGSWIEKAPDLVPRGRLLSIREASDDILGSCADLFARAPEGTEHKELVLGLGNGHGAFYKPQPAWVDPILEWAAPKP